MRILPRQCRVAAAGFAFAVALSLLLPLTPEAATRQGAEPMDSLSGVSCAGASACMAVGFQTASNVALTLAERWDGSQWTVVPTPAIEGATAAGLYSVSCPDMTMCMAVGYVDDALGRGLTLAERWDGTQWSVLHGPGSSRRWGALLSVSCTSDTACTAVGTRIERWDGTGWTVQANPSPNGSLEAVSCTTDTACTAVGHRGAFAFAETWNGTVWTVQPTPRPDGAEGSLLSGVACVTAQGCVAVGEYQDGQGEPGLAERSSGPGWTLQSIPNRPRESSFLLGVACDAPASCVAVGNAMNSRGATATLAEAWNGTAWALTTTVNPSGTVDDGLAAVACTAADACTAVGDDFDTNHANLTLVERWNGVAWATQSSPSP